MLLLPVRHADSATFPVPDDVVFTGAFFIRAGMDLFRSY
jgi:hypothetical protein